MSKKRLLVLGSAAAEAVPAIFCDCDTCKYAWEHGGKDMRLRAAYMLGDQVRIDFGPDNVAQEHRYQLHSENLKHLFITHSHEDHFVPDMLDYRRKGMSRVAEDNILNFYGGAGTIRKLNRSFWDNIGFGGEYLKTYRLNVNKVEPGVPVELPDQDMTFVPMLADHMTNFPAEIPLFYAVRWGDKRFMIANDTGYFPELTWEILAKLNWKFDLVISDCTGCTFDIKHGHMSGKYVVEVKERMAQAGWIDSNTRYCINHFSHNGGSIQSKLEAHFNPLGIEVCYDGMEIYL